MVALALARIDVPSNVSAVTVCEASLAIATTILRDVPMPSVMFDEWLETAPAEEL